MKAKLKQFIEQILGWNFWIERSADPARINALIRSLRPKSTVAPLVRIGPNGDGGYLLPDDLDGISVCVSPGISVEIGFDLAMAERGIRVFMADASVDGPPQSNSRFQFVKKFLDVFEDDKHIRLDSLCASIQRELCGDRILQMDIEGAEWRVLLDANSETLRMFRIMVIEFHDLKQVFSRYSFDFIEATFRKILQTHSVVHLHPNNIVNPTVFDRFSVPSLMEITFYRNDRPFSMQTNDFTYPHPLDIDNVSSSSTVVLPGCWRS
ncbi:MAG: FkbM family methyltransferase [Candidatus Competibacteraceae bacterium]|nr:MAG: FkbM family methyltransferase [Candidatus Competibacteraceae bacterium]